MEALYNKAVAAGQKNVVIYGPSAGTDMAMYAAFKKSFPDITVTGVPVVGPPMTAKLSAEMSSGKHVDDIAYTGSTDMLAYIKSGWFTPFKPSTLPPASQLAAECYGPDNNFFGFTVGLSGMVYNTNSVQASQAPTTWTGLLDSQWKNKMVMYDPTAIGEMDDIFAHLALVPGDSGMMTGLKAQNTQLSPSSDITGPQTAVGTSLLVIAVNSAVALTARLGGGVRMDWPLIGVFTLAALAGTLAGNRVASRVSASRLTAAFTVLLIVVAAYTLARSLPTML